MPGGTPVLQGIEVGPPVGLNRHDLTVKDNIFDEQL
jgi:hypothetical protein